MALIAHWPLDGRLDDISGHGRHLTNLCSKVVEDKEFGKVFELDNSGLYSELPIAEGYLGNHIAISFWMRDTKPDTEKAGTIFAVADKCGLENDAVAKEGLWYVPSNSVHWTDSRAGFLFQSFNSINGTARGYIKSTTPNEYIGVNEWCFVVLNIDRTTESNCKLYINGFKQTTEASNFWLGLNPGFLFIGTDPNVAVADKLALTGVRLFDLRIHNGPLTEEYIQTLYKQRSHSLDDKRPKLVAHWPLGSYHGLSALVGNYTMTHKHCVQKVDPTYGCDCYYLNGTNSEMQSTYIPDNTKDFSISAKMKVFEKSYRKCLIGAFGKIGLKFNSDDVNYITLVSWANDKKTNMVYKYHNWTEYTIQFLTSIRKKRLYMDGLLIDESDYEPEKWTRADSPLTFGGYFGSSIDDYRENYAEMSIRDIKIYEGVLPVPEKYRPEFFGTDRRSLVEIVRGDGMEVGDEPWVNVARVSNDRYPYQLPRTVSSESNCFIKIPVNNELVGKSLASVFIKGYFRVDAKTLSVNRFKCLMETTHTTSSRPFVLYLDGSNCLCCMLSNGGTVITEFRINKEGWIYFVLSVDHEEATLFANGNKVEDIVYTKGTGSEIIKFGTHIDIFRHLNSKNDPTVSNASNYQFYGTLHTLCIGEWDIPLPVMQREFRKLIPKYTKDDYTVDWWPMDGSQRNISNVTNPFICNVVGVENSYQSIRFKPSSATSNDVVQWEHDGPLGVCMSCTDAFSHVQLYERSVGPVNIDENRFLSFSCRHKIETGKAITYNFFRNCGSYPVMPTGGIWIEIDTSGHLSVYYPNTNPGTNNSRYVKGTKVFSKKDQWFHFYFYLDVEKRALDVYIDGEHYETLTLNMNGDEQLNYTLGPTFPGGFGGGNGKYCDYRFFNRKLKDFEIRDVARLEVLSISAHPKYEKNKDILPDYYVKRKLTTLVGNGAWDNTKHVGAILPLYTWSSGFNSGVARPSEGYHAYWINMDGQLTLVMRNINSKIDPALRNRWMGVANNGAMSNSPYMLSWNLEPGKIYTLSADVMATELGVGLTVGFYRQLNLSDGTVSGARFDNNISALLLVDEVGIWQRKSFTFKVPDNYRTNGVRQIYLYGSDTLGKEGVAYYRNISLVKGESVSKSITYNFRVNEPTENPIYQAEIDTTSSPRYSEEERSLYFVDHFNAQTSRISIPGFVPSNVLTYTAWIRTADQTAYGICGLNTYTQYEGLGIDNGKLAFRYWRCTTDTDAVPQYDRIYAGVKTINDNRWHMVTVTIDHEFTLKLYVDGELDATHTNVKVRMNKPIESLGFIVGSNGSYDSSFPFRVYYGHIKSLKVYGTALSADFIKTLYTKENFHSINSRGDFTSNIIKFKKDDDTTKGLYYVHGDRVNLLDITKNSLTITAKLNDGYTDMFLLPRGIKPGQVVKISFTIIPLNSPGDTTVEMILFDRCDYITTPSFAWGSFTEGERREVSFLYRNISGSVLTYGRFDVNSAGKTVRFENFNIDYADTDVRKIEFKKIKKMVNNNLMSTDDWVTTPFGLVPGYIQQFLSTDDPSKRIITENPWGEKDLVWAHSYLNIDSNGDGGWNYDLPFNSKDILTKPLRFSVWVRFENLEPTSAVRFYMGLNNQDQGEVLSPTGSEFTNPYFIGMVGDKLGGGWFLSVGYVYPENWDNDQINAFENSNLNHTKGMIDLNGVMKVPGNSFKYKASVMRRIRHRTYSYYSDKSDISVYFYRPRIDFMDAYAPSLGDLIQGKEQNNLIDGPTVPEDERFIDTKYLPDGSKWGLIIQHKHNNGAELFDSNLDSFLNCDTSHLKSRFYLLNSCRMNSRFEFLLEYEGLSGYNRWKQSTNPLYASVINHYEPIHIDFPGGVETVDNIRYNFIGILRTVTDLAKTKSWLKCSEGNESWWFAIGCKQNYRGGIPGPTNHTTDFTEVRLWVRIHRVEHCVKPNEFICRDTFNA